MIYKVIALKTQVKNELNMYKNNLIAQSKTIVTTSDSFNV